MNCFDKFKRKMEYSGGSFEAEQIMNGRYLLNEVFEDSASICNEIYRWELGLLEKDDYIDKQGISMRLYKERYSSANGTTIHFQTLYNEPVYLGEVFYNAKTDYYWICTEIFNRSNVNWEGKLTRCNYILKWQNKDGDILKYPCYDFNATQYNSGEKGTQQMTVGSSQHMVLLPYDENTVLLDTPQRFILDKNPINPTVFIVTQNDTTSLGDNVKGIVKVTLAQNALDLSKDRVDLGICDYFEKEVGTDNDSFTDSDNNLYKSTITYKKNIIKSGGSYQTFTGNFFDEYDNEVTLTPKWEVVCDFVDELIIQKDGNEIKIKIDNDDYIDEDFRLVFSDEEGNYSSSIIVTIRGLI